MSDGFVSAWRNEGERQLAGNLELFRRNLDIARTLVGAMRYDEAAAHATIAAYQAHRRHCGLFVSRELEELVMRIGLETLPRGTGWRKSSPTVQSVVHVGTNMSLISGNPRLVRR